MAHDWLFTNSLDAVFLTVPDGRILAANPAACRMLGRSEDEICRIGRSGVLDLSDPRLPAALAERERTGQLHAELTFIRADGTRFPGDISSAVFRDNEGNARSAMIVRDASERKRLEHEKEQYFRFFTLSSDPMCIADPFGCFKHINPAFVQLTGYSEAELVSKPFLDFVLPEDRQETADEMKLQVEARPSMHFENRYVCKDGNIVHLSWTAYFDRNDGVTYATARDITERKRADNALRAASLYARNLIEASPDPLVTINAEGKVTDVNRATENATGFGREQLIGTDFSDYFTDPEKARAGYRQVFAEGYVTDYPLTIRHRQGRLTDVLYNASVYRNEQGQVLGVFAAARDITERKRTEEALHRSQAGLEEAQQLAHIGNWSWDIPTDTIEWSSEYYRVYNFDPKLPTPGYADHLKVYTAESAGMLDAAVKRAMETGEPYALELQLAKSDVAGKWILARGAARRDAQGKITGLYGTAQDITERKKAEEDRRIASLYARNLIETSLDPLVTISAEGKITDVNKATEEVTGIGREKLIGTDFADYFTEPANARAGYRQVLAQGYVRDYPLTIRHRAGGTTDVLYNAAVYRNEAGELQGVFAAARDITERKRAEIALRDSEQNYRTLSDSAPALIWASGTDKLCNYFNQPWLKFTGRTLAQELGNGWTEGVHPDDFAQCLATYVEAFDKREPFSMEYRLRRHDGEFRWIRDDGCPRYASGGEFIGYLGYIMDITERKQGEGLRAQLAAIVQSSHDAIIGKDLDGIITSWNPGAEKVYGYRADEAIGKPVSMLAPESRKDEIASLMEKIRLGEAVMNYETERLRKAGKRIDISLDLSPIMATTGRVVGASIIARDITEKKQAERALHKVNRALQALSNCNAALIHATEEFSLLKDMCRVIVETEGYRLAWVGYAEHDASKTVRPVAQCGYESGYMEHANISWADDERGRGPLGIAIRTGQIQVVQDVKTDPRFEPWRANAAKLGYGSVLVAPLISESETLGALSIYAEGTDAFDAGEIALLSELAADMAYGIVTLRTRSAQEHSAERLQQSMETTIQVIAGTVEMRDAYTAGHQRRVAELAAAIARDMGLPEDRVRGIRLAGVVHDLGKIRIPAEILSKPGKLTPIEFELIKTHPEAGYEILKGVDFPWPIAQIVLQHHERLDGSGYPRGLKGDEILLEARILMVADVVEAMASHRPYRPALGTVQALEEISAQAGKYYDAEVAQACIRLFREKAFAFKE